MRSPLAELYDEACKTLAEHFIDDLHFEHPKRDELVRKLAVQVQKCVEGFFEEEGLDDD
jgi:hypothetical protein